MCFDDIIDLIPMITIEMIKYIPTNTRNESYNTSSDGIISVNMCLFNPRPWIHSLSNYLNNHCLWIQYYLFSMDLHHHFNFWICSIYVRMISYLNYLYIVNIRERLKYLLLDHYWIIINFVHYWSITVFQVNNSQD